MFYFESMRNYVSSVSRPSLKQTAVAVTVLGALTGYMELGFASTAIVGAGLACTAAILNGLTNAVFHANPVQQAQAPETLMEKAELTLSFSVAALSTGYLYTNVYLALETLPLTQSLDAVFKTILALLYQLSYVFPIGVLGPKMLRAAVDVMKNGSRQERLLFLLATLMGLGMVDVAGTAAFRFYENHPESSGLNALFQMLYGQNLELTLLLHLPINLLATMGNVEGIKTLSTCLSDLYQRPTMRKVAAALAVFAVNLISLTTTLFVIEAGDGLSLKTSIPTLGALLTATISNLKPSIQVVQAGEEVTQCHYRAATAVLAGSDNLKSFSASCRSLEARREDYLEVPGGLLNNP